MSGVIVRVVRHVRRRGRTVGQADALGLHLDLFQRIIPEPGSVTALRYTAERPYLLRFGDTGELAGLAPLPANDGEEAGEDAADDGNAPVGGGA
jgi:hypothetical protein